MKTACHLVIVFSLFILLHQSASASTCVITDQKIHGLRGRVAFERPDYFVQGAKLTLTDRSEAKNTIKTGETREDGWFEMEGVPKGRYILIVSFPYAYSLYIPIKVTKRSGLRYLFVRLGGRYNESCGGGAVEVKK